MTSRKKTSDWLIRVNKGNLSLPWMAEDSRTSRCYYFKEIVITASPVTTMVETERKILSIRVFGTLQSVKGYATIKPDGKKEGE